MAVKVLKGVRPCFQELAQGGVAKEPKKTGLMKPACFATHHGSEVKVG